MMKAPKYGQWEPEQPELGSSLFQASTQFTQLTFESFDLMTLDVTPGPYCRTLILRASWERPTGRTCRWQYRSIEALSIVLNHVDQHHGHETTARGNHAFDPG